MDRPHGNGRYHSVHELVSMKQKWDVLEDDGSRTDQGVLACTRPLGRVLSFDTVQSCGPFYGIRAASRARVSFSENVSRQYRSAHQASGMMPRGGTHPGIKAINKIIALVILFQSSGLLVHPVAAMVNFLTVTGVACCSPSGAPRKARRTCTSAG